MRFRPDDRAFPPLLGSREWLSDPLNLRAFTQPQRVRGTHHGYVGLLGHGRAAIQRTRTHQPFGSPFLAFPRSYLPDESKVRDGDIVQAEHASGEVLAASTYFDFSSFSRASGNNGVPLFIHSLRNMLCFLVVLKPRPDCSSNTPNPPRRAAEEGRWIRAVKVRHRGAAASNPSPKYVAHHSSFRQSVPRLNEAVLCNLPLPWDNLCGES